MMLCFNCGSRYSAKHVTASGILTYCCSEPCRRAIDENDAHPSDQDLLKDMATAARLEIIVTDEARGKTDQALRKTVARSTKAYEAKITYCGLALRKMREVRRLRGAGPGHHRAGLRAPGVQRRARADGQQHALAYGMAVTRRRRG